MAIKKQSRSVLIPVIVSIVTCTLMFVGFSQFSNLKKSYDAKNKQRVEQNFQKRLNLQKENNRIKIDSVSINSDIITINGEVPNSHTVKWVFSNAGCANNSWYSKIISGPSVPLVDNKFKLEYKLSGQINENTGQYSGNIGINTSHYEKYEDIPDEQILGDGTKVCHTCNPMNQTREAWIDTPNLFIREWSGEVCNSGKKQMIPSINSDDSIILDLKNNKWCFVDNYSGGQKICSEITKTKSVVIPTPTPTLKNTETSFCPMTSDKYATVIDLKDSLGNVFKQSAYNRCSSNGGQYSVRKGETLTVTVNSNNIESNPVMYQFVGNGFPNEWQQSNNVSVKIENDFLKYATTNLRVFIKNSDNIFRAPDYDDMIQVSYKIRE